MACAVEAVTVARAPFRAGRRRAVGRQQLRRAGAHAMHAGAHPTAIERTVALRTALAPEAGQAVAGPIVAVAVAAAVERAGAQRAVVPVPPRFALARIVDTLAMVGAPVGTRANRARGTREAHIALARAVEARAMPRTLERARPKAAIVPTPTGLAHTSLRRA